MLPRLLRSAALMTAALLGLAGCMNARIQESREQGQLSSKPNNF